MGVSRRACLMTYASAIDYLYGLQKHGIKLGLDTMQALMDRLGHPERRYPVLHIGGTNGKGSTAAITAAILQAAGLRVGLYTSPHLVEYRERIRVNGEMIAEDCVAELTARVQRSVSESLEPTFFEATTALAFLHFADARVDIAVLEVGLGGRFDATNVVDPLACAVITIALDHQEYLGGTEEAIAFEKAGIVKSAAPVVTGRIESAALSVIRTVAEESGAPLWQLGQDFAVEGQGPERFTYRGKTQELEGLSCALPGRHQLDNAACALALLEAAGEAGGPAVDETAVRAGLQSVQWEGRLECIGHDPLVVLDGAHNPAAGAALARYLSDYAKDHPAARIILILGMMRDKDYQSFVKSFQSLVAEIILTQASLARSATVGELRAALVNWTQPVFDAHSPAAALALARNHATANDLICVTGSLMLLGDLKAAVRGCGLSPLRG
jgi:dihydrofolate synthase / folylpolyglutamate synthase